MSIEPGTGYYEGSIAIVCASLLLIIFYLITECKPVMGFFLKRHRDDKAQIWKVLFNRLAGVFILGIVPIVLIPVVIRRPFLDFGMDTETLFQSLLVWIPTSALVIILAYFMTRRKSFLARYPQIRAGEWDIGLISLSALSWIVYLAGYEMFFRGFLLFACYSSFGFWPAIFINIVLYMLAHIPKGSLETFGSIPLGFFFCYITLQIGSIWFALFTHITIALANEWFSIYHNTGMKVLPLKRSGR